MSGEDKSMIVDESDRSDTVRTLRLLMENLRNSESSMEGLRNQLSKVSQRKISLKKRSDKCVHCEAKVELDKLKEFVTCKGCEELACHNQKCSEFIFELGVWECARCQKNRVIQQRAGEWLLKQLNQAKNSDGPAQLTKESLMSLDDEHSLAAFVSRNQRDKVRTFIEELLAKILDGSLDDVSVGQLSNDDSCLPLVGPIPTNVTHQELKRFIQAICEEIVNLPNTLDFSGVPGRQEDPVPFFDPKRYEQLVATAVLNKMTDFYQNDKNSQHNSSGIHSDVELDSNHNQLNGKAMIDLMVKRDEAGEFSSPTIERLNSKAADDETHLSDYVQNHLVPLPDLSASDSANDDVDVQSVNSSNGTDATWEDNWLFKKRKLKTENQSIAMLVPSPTEEIKALIGDKNADETSDLSENSESEDEIERPNATFTSTFTIEAKSSSDPISVGEISAISVSQPVGSDSLKSMQSLTSFDTDSPAVVTEAKNNRLLIENENEPTTPQLIQKIEFLLNGPVTVTENSLNELSVDVQDQTEEEKEFDSMVSPTQVKDHEKTIDDQFEKLLLDSPMNITPVTSVRAESNDSSINLINLETPKSNTARTSTPAQLATKTDLSDSEEWVMVPSADEKVLLDQYTPVEQKTESNESQVLPGEAIASTEEPTKAKTNTEHNRYNSPLFQELAQPIVPVRISQLSIPADDSINNLLRATSLVSKTQKTPEIVETEDETNKSNKEETEEAIDERLLKELSVPDKRPSLQDPEKVLMENVVPGSIAEREHIKWLHAAPIANNPYSTEALQRRLSETDHKHKNLDISNNSKMVDTLVEESNASEAEKEENEEVFQAKKIDMKKYKRDYYINDPPDSSEKRRSYGSSTSKSPSFEHEEEQSDNIVPVSSGEKGFRARVLPSSDIGTVETSVESDQDSSKNLLSAPKSVKSNEDSLTFSEDSDTTRIYNLDTRETKIVAPTDESPIESPVRIAKQFFRSISKQHTAIRKMDDEVTTVVRTSNRNLTNGSGSEHIVQETYEEKQVIEPEVIDNLPSVKKLAEIYGKDVAPSEIQLVKPKAFVTAAAVDDGIEPVVQHAKLAKAASESFAPNYDINYHPAMPIASITARSIPSQIRADLKKSYSYDEETIVRQGEREGSPEIQPGVTRNSIAFFEQLNQK